MENPYQPPAHAHNPSVPAIAPHESVFNLYRILAACHFAATLALSVGLKSVPEALFDTPLRHLLVFLAFVFLWGLILALATIPAFLLRSLYLVAESRFREAAIDATFAPIAFLIGCAAWLICPLD
jgi:hypothetical protein